MVRCGCLWQWQRQKDVNSWAEGNESTQHEGCLAFTTVDVGKTIEINEALTATDRKFQTIKVARACAAVGELDGWG